MMKNTRFFAVTAFSTSICCMAMLLFSFGNAYYKQVQTNANDVPSKINYQGILLDNGQPFTGTKTITFSIGSTWSETHTNVPVNEGRYLVQLGAINSLSVADFEGAANPALHIKVGSTDLSPDIDFLTVPYAFFSQKAEDANLLSSKDSSFYLDYNNLSNSPSTSDIYFPTGTILPFAGYQTPPGWLLCDGSQISRTTYADLFQAIGVRWGGGNSVSTFHLPDLRGRFLRGVSQSTNNDPDKNSRVALYTAGNTGNKIGTYQDDSYESHSHTYPQYAIDDADNGGSFVFKKFNTWDLDNPILTPLSTNASGGSETRPINANVYFIIKY